MRLAAAVFLALLLLPALAFAGPLEDARYAYYDLGDYPAALKLVQPLADQGNGEAQELLGDMYFHGAGLPQDMKLRAKWYTEAVASYRKAADQGDAAAQVRLGMLYEGWNVPGLKHDYDEAMKWFHKAADQGNSEAELHIGTLYSWGWGVTQDTTETLRWWHAAAEHGNAEAQMQLGQLYNRTQNYEEALKWWQKGAEQDDGYSQINLASMYSDGHGVKQDDTEALKWIRRAADHGFGNAEVELGVMYEYGRGGVKQDYAEAYFWYSLRGAQFSSSGLAERSAKYLTPEQKAAIDIRVKEWKPTRIQPPALVKASVHEAIVPLGHSHLPEGVAQPLADATQVTLYSLNDVTSEHNIEKFHGYPILGKTELTGAQAKSATNAFQDAVAAGNGISMCFEPHHALRIISAGHTYDYLLCYTCSGIEVYEDDKKITYQGARGSPDILNDLLTVHHIAISPNAVPKNMEVLRRQQHDEWLQNLKKAKEYADSLQPQAENGDSKAQLFLGNYYGVQFFSCDQKDTKNNGPLTLGQPYCTSYKDALKAAMWFRKAADQGDPEAQLKLGKMYVDGSGLKQDNKEAYFWYSLAARHYSASPWMKKDIETVTQNLSREQIAAVDKRVAEWRPTSGMPPTPAEATSKPETK